MSATRQEPQTVGSSGATREDALYLVHLIDCSLHGASPSALPEGADWERVSALARRNSVEAMAGVAAAEAPGCPEELAGRWREAVTMTLWRRLQFDAEREQVFSALAAEDLSYLPMKGVLVADYYPRPDLRSMADNDFLYGFVEPLPAAEREALGLAASGNKGFRVRGATPDERERTVEEGTRTIARVMEARGYTAKSLRTGCHESFMKKPMFNFEPHRRLMSPSNSMAPYYENPWARAIQDASDPYLFRFSDEDEYVYLLAHAFKHFDAAGCGVRYVVDVRVFLGKKGAGLDRAYVDVQLAELGLAEFEARSRSLADAAFGGAAGGGLPALSPDDEELLLFLLGCGTYGNETQRIENALAKQLDANGGDLAAAKRSYLWSRVSSRECVAAMFPRASRVRALYPLLVAVRLVVKGVSKPGKWARELRTVRKSGRD